MKPLNFIIVLLIIFIATDWILLLANMNDGWDLYHLMYPGQRLLHGELSWTVEYVDKLIITQILFFLPALFKSIKVWFLISAVSVSLAAVAIIVFFDHIFSDDKNISRKTRRILGVTAAISTIYFFTELPGNIAHINAISASAAIISLTLLAKSLTIKLNKSLRLTSFFISALIASISIGLRPYFLFTLVCAPIFFFARSSRPWFGYNGVFVLSAFWVLLVAIFGLLANMVPFFIAKNMDAFLAGMSMFTQKLNPGGSAFVIIGDIIWDTFKQPALTVFLIILYLASPIMAIISMFSKDKPINSQVIFSSIIFLTLFLPFLILMLILSRHYWTHYLQFFAPFWGMGVGFFFYFCFKYLNEKLFINNSLIWSFTISLVSILIIPQLIQNFKDIKNITFEEIFTINERNNLILEISRVISSQSKNKRDFLFIDNMHPHWSLNEFRHGFPQAAHSRHIIKNEWWKNISMPNHFGHPTNSNEYCLQLEKKGPTLVFLSYELSEFESNCLKKSLNYKFFKKLINNTSLYHRN